MKYSRRRSRRLRNPNEKESANKPFFGKSNDTAVQAKEETPFFQAKPAMSAGRLTLGKPGDKYEQEADAVADAVVNQSSRAGGIQKKEGEAIQKVDLATPQEEEKLGTAEQRLERDKEIQEKPDLQAMDKEEEVQMQAEEEEMAQMMGEEEEEVQMQAEEEEMAQMMGEEEEEPMQMQAEEEEEMAQMQAEEEEEPMQMQAEEEEEMAQMQAEEEEEPMQMQAEEEEEMAQMQAEEEEEPMQMQAEEEEEMAQMQAEEEEEPMQMQAEEEEMAQMMGGKEEEEAVQAKRDRPASRQHAKAKVSKKIKETKGRGRPIPEKNRAEMEQAFGVDFSGVNIHTGQDAVQMNKALRAQAFASGKDIFFNTGKFNPENTAGKHLLAHELTHVVQQKKGALEQYK